MRCAHPCQQVLVAVTLMAADRLHLESDLSAQGSKKVRARKRRAIRHCTDASSQILGSTAAGVHVQNI